MNILIADDEPLDRELLAAQLTHWGHSVTACADGLEAWAALERRDGPGLVLLDWMMPGLDGPELCRRIRATPRLARTYAILVTGRGRREDLVAGLASGADDYVVKPFDEGELRARLQVGLRVVELWERLLETERLQVLVQAAGGAAHEINQPLSVILGLSQLLERDPGLREDQRRRVQGIRRAVDQIAATVRRMGAVEQYAARPYLDGAAIVDFGADSERDDAE